MVCSRIADYEALGTPLRLQGASGVQPLIPPQIEGYLTQVGPPLAAVREALRDDTTLWELVDTPLMLTIVTLAYAGQPVQTLRTQGTLEERRQRLFAAYADHMFRRRSASTSYTRQQTRHSQTVLSLERLQPAWLAPRQHWVPTHGARLVVGLIGGMGFGLGGGLLTGLIVELRDGLGLRAGHGDPLWGTYLSPASAAPLRAQV